MSPERQEVLRAARELLKRPERQVDWTILISAVLKVRRVDPVFRQLNIIDGSEEGLTIPDMIN